MHADQLVRRCNDMANQPNTRENTQQNKQHVLQSIMPLVGCTVRLRYGMLTYSRTAVQPYGRSERMLCSASSSAATLLHCFAASRLHISAAVFTTVCWTAAAGAAGAKSCIGTPSPPASAYLRPPPPPPTPLWRLLSPLTRRLLNPPAGLCLGNCIVDGLKRSYFLFSEHLFAVVQRQR